ncbi:hypothetical protein AB6A40_010052 [Gnathostoma spinigerum]|uniref:Uncharacterized protein n=1 Tax=Gnathostoma spinigerum TaxID=75299 RepID=A0ABD6EU51_9BILA
MDEIKVLAEKYKKLSPQLFNSEIFFEQILQVETDVGTDFAKRVEQVVLLFLRYILNSKFVLRRSDLLASAIKFNRWQNIPLILTEFEGGFSKSGANVAQTALDQSRLLCLIQIYLNHLPLIYERKGATVSVFRRLFRRMKKSMFDSSHGPFSGNSVTCVPPVQLFAYGQNSALTLGIPFGEKTHHPTPVSFNCNITSLKKISYGGSHTLFLSDEDLYVCGTGQCGKLGTGNEKDCVEPLYVRGDIIDIAAGPKHSVVCTKTKVSNLLSTSKASFSLTGLELVILRFNALVAKFVL